MGSLEFFQFPRSNLSIYSLFNVYMFTISTVNKVRDIGHYLCRYKLFVDKSIQLFGNFYDKKEIGIIIIPISFLNMTQTQFPALHYTV